MFFFLNSLETKQVVGLEIKFFYFWQLAKRQKCVDIVALLEQMRVWSGLRPECYVLVDTLWIMSLGGGWSESRSSPGLS